MSKSKFSYETYIATTVEMLWKALLDGEFTRRYWGHENISDWHEGSAWEHRRADNTRALVVLGEVLEAPPPTAWLFHGRIRNIGKPKHVTAE
jgi:uncharacterized protein YndB with AHSA1/START domain